MIDSPETLAATLLRVSVTQFLLMLLVRRWSQRHGMNSLRTCRAVCVLVLLQGCLLVPITIPIAWYESPAAGDNRTTSDAAAGSSSREAARDEWPLSSSNDAGRVTRNAATAPTGTHVSSHAASLAFPWTETCRGLILVWLAGIAFLAARSVVSYARHVFIPRTATNESFNPEPESSEATAFLLTHRRLRRLRLRVKRAKCVNHDHPQYRRRNDLSADGPWQREWSQLLQHRGIRREIPLIETAQLGPMLCLLPSGYVLCVPRDFSRTATPQERRIVLRHELAHYERGDVWKSWLVRMMALPQWFNPAAWWAVCTFEQCAERSCDVAAAATSEEQLELAKLLSRLAAKHLPPAAFGLCVHSHPLVTRVRCLLNPQLQKESVMKKFVVVAIAGACVALQLFRVELVAKEKTPATKESVQKQVEELDQKLALLKADVKNFKETGKAVKQEVEAKVEELKTLAKDKANLSDELKRRVALFETGDEAKQLEALDKLEDLNENEGLLALGAVAKDSQHEKVRQKALHTIAGWRKAGLPAFAFAASSLSNADQMFFVKELAKHDTTENLFLLALLATKTEDEKLREAARQVGFASQQRLLFVATVAEAFKDNESMILNLVKKTGSDLKGDDGLLLLCAAAKSSEAKYQIAAIQEAVKLKEDGLPVLVAAFASKDPEVRAEIVRGAKAIGGPVAQFAIDEALREKDDVLRKAAEDALKPQE